MARRCPQARRIATARLPDHRLVFRGRGVASVEPAPGNYVRGVLYDLQPLDEDNLDRCEGIAMGVYRRRWTSVLVKGGKKVFALVYVHTAAHPRMPTVEYEGRIRSAYLMLGFDVGAIDDALDEAIVSLGEESMSKVFVYGSLLRGESNHRVLGGSQMVGTGMLPDAVMYDLGSFPAVVRGEGCVVGEVYEVTADVLRALDRIEGHPHLYRRAEVALDDGEVVETYLYARRPSGPVVHSGSWRAHLRVGQAHQEPPNAQADFHYHYGRRR